MKYCSNCGFQVRDTDNFCSNCGTKIVISQSSDSERKLIQVKICDLCGEENSINSDECSYCGVGFSGKEKVIEKEISEPEESIKTKSKFENLSRNKVDYSMRKSPAKKSENLDVKRLTPMHLTAGVVVMSALAAALIYYGYVSSNPEVKKTQTQQPNVQPRIDLSVINEINKLEEELSKDPNNGEKLLRLAHLTHDAGFFEKAINYYERYLKINPNDNDAETDLGVCFFELKQYDRALSIFESVIKKNPKHQIAYLNLGIVHLTKGEVEKAKEFFKKCIEIGEHTDAGHRAAELLNSH